MIIYIQILAYIIFIAWYVKNSISIIKYWGSLGSEELEQTDHIRGTPVFRRTKIKLLTGLFVMAISLLSGMREFIPIGVFAMIIAISELYVHLTWFAWKTGIILFGRRLDIPIRKDRTPYFYVPLLILYTGITLFTLGMSLSVIIEYHFDIKLMKYFFF